MENSTRIRILLVDDEPMILSGLRRALFGYRDRWETRFADSGSEALEMMAAEQFDVVVTDMRMPGMNGAELLRQVAERYPEVIRFVLSGFADQDLILQCTGTAHQYLSKPCDPGELIRAISRATALEARLKNEAVRRFVGGLQHLPTIPEVYSALVEATSDPDASVEKIGEIISRDVSMTANLLKLVNSPFFGLRRSISSPEEAAAFLGIDRVKHLLLSLKVFDQFDHSSTPGFSVSELWRHSLDVGAIAALIARAERAPENVHGECFVAGMLHDVGKLILAGNFSDEYGRVQGLAAEEGLRLFEAEEEIFGMNHADVGGYLLGLWGLPDGVVEAIAWHHAPLTVPEPTFGTLAAVYIADAINRNGEEAGEDPELMEYLARVGLQNRLHIWCAELDETHKAVV